MRREVKQVIGIFGAWILMAAVIYIIAPPDLKWLAWVPSGFILLAVIISSIAYLLKKAGFFKPPTEVYVDGKFIKACMFCPMNRIKENPLDVNGKSLIYKCSAKEMQIIYLPGKVPGWCPYVIS